jgi:hypothetical protein
MLSNEIPIVTVSYNSPDLISDLLVSIRKFYKNTIYVIDGSDSENASQTKKLAESYQNIFFIGFDHNIHHGPGMAWAINNLPISGPVLFIDSDMTVIEHGFLEELHSHLQDHMYGVGNIIHVNREGFTVFDNIDENSVKYLHPALMLCNIEEMRKWPLPIKHGAPMTETMIALHDAGKSHLLAEVEWVFDVIEKTPDVPPKFLIHEGRGTVKRSGSYNLDEWMQSVIDNRQNKSDKLILNNDQSLFIKEKIVNHEKNELIDYFYNSNHRMIHKWIHYFDVYENSFSKFKGQDINLLEFGVLHGGSLQMWKHYFGSASNIYGADINPRCLQLAEDRIEIRLVDQDSKESLLNLANTLPGLDVIIDDGGHTMNHQINTLEVFWRKLKVGGIYMCEDTHTSYWPGFGGGLKKPGTFIEYVKSLIDELTAWHYLGSDLPKSEFTKSAFAIHFYDSIVVIEKREITPPITKMKGTPSFPLAPAEQFVYDNS